MINFDCHSDCEVCPLHETAEHPGLPTVRYVPEPFDDQGQLKPTPGILKKRALLIVGEAPGRTEDEESIFWTGKAGKILRRFVSALRYEDHVDVYLSNACRCRPPGNDTPTASQVKRCRPYLMEDIAKLHAAYGDLTILCCGASGCRAIRGTALKTGFQYQGEPVELELPATAPDGTPVESTVSVRPPVFYTYHTANLLSGRNPSLIRAVEDHLHVLRDYLRGTWVPPRVISIPPRAPAPPDTFESHVCIDIETYGVLAGKNQTVFHPRKSEVIDGIKRKDLVVSVALGYKQAGEIRTAFFLWPDDKRRFFEWLRLIHSTGVTLTGKNTTFDLQYLRYVSPEFRQIIPVGYPVDDLAIWNFLDYELRPEKGLKDMAALANVANYRDLSVRADREAKALTRRDPELAIYNATDCVATLRLHDQYEASIRARYTEESFKLRATCARHRSELVWCVVGMSEAGMPMDRERLQTLHDRCTFVMDRLMAHADDKYDVPLAGVGSAKPIRDAITESLQPDLINDPRCEVTKKRRQVSTGKKNLQLIMASYPAADPRRRVPALLKAYRHYQKIQTSYTAKLLGGKQDGLIGSENIAYPSWFPVPGHPSRDATEEEGGTIQARFAASNPSAQNEPPVVKNCITTRFGEQGLVLWADESQLELRIATLLSGDDLYMRAYSQDLDVHHQTAELIYPDRDLNALSRTSPVAYNQCRQIGKKTNFLVLYRGGPKKLQETVRADVGIELPFPACQRIVNSYWPKHPRLFGWQEALYDVACTLGYLELWTGWSRTFSGTPKVVRDTYFNEIPNFPVQTYAAQVVQSAQYCIYKELVRLRSRAVISLQVHDSIVIDTPRIEYPLVKSLLDRYLPNPPLYQYLCEKAGRTVPLRYDLKAYDCHGNPVKTP